MFPEKRLSAKSSISAGRFLRPMAIFKPPRLGPDFSNQHRRNPVLFLAMANSVSHANVLSGCKDFTHNHANTFPPLKIIQTISWLIRLKSGHFMRIIDYFKWDCECSVSMFLIQTDIDCGTHLCTGWCFCPGLPLLTLFFHTCRGQREQQGQLKWKNKKYISMYYMKRGQNLF